MQSMVLQIIGSNYHALLKHFRMINGVVFGIKKIVEVSSFLILFDFTMGLLLFK